MTFRLRTVLFGLACAGTASVGCSGPADTATTTFPETCAEAQEAAVDETGDRPTDGTYTLYIGGDEASPWDAYCYNMRRAEPSDYLSVSEDENYSQLGNGVRIVESKYRRIRIDPVRLELWPLDTTFATTDDDDDDVTVLDAQLGTGVEHVPLGLVSYFAPVFTDDAGGGATSSVDLSDTAFIFDESIDDDDVFLIGKSGDLNDDGDYTSDTDEAAVTATSADGTTDNEDEDDLSSFDTASDLTSFVLSAEEDDGNVRVRVAVDYEAMIDNITGGTLDDADEVDSVVIPLVYNGQ